MVGGRWSDAFKIEGMRGGAITFDLSAGRDVEIRQAIAKRDLKEKAARSPETMNARNHAGPGS